jgi:Pro-kumamolisin, activation domain/Bacterial Ig-like domain (group 1)
MPRPLPLRSRRSSSLFPANTAGGRYCRRSRLLLVGAALACLVAPARGVAGRPSAVRRRATPSSTVRLPGHVLPALANATPASQAAGTAPLTLTLVLRHDDQPGFERYLHALHDPQSPSYRHFLSQQDIADRFGPSRRTYDHVLAYLRANGFELVEGSANRLTLTVRGSRAAAEDALLVHIRDYRLGDRAFFANDGDPALPRQLASHVAAVAGLSDLARPAPTVKRGFYKLACEFLLAPVPPPPGYKLCAPGSANPLKQCLTAAEQAAQNDLPFNFDFFAYESFYTFERVVPISEPCPPDTGPVTNAFHRAASPGAGIPLAQASGSNQTVALVEFDTFEQTDVADYLALLELPAAQLGNLSAVHVNGGAAPGPDQEEVLLDIDTVMTIAPSAKVVVYDAPFSGAGSSFQAVFNAAINGGATIISNSWAYCEDQTSLADVQGIDAIFQNAAMSNISIFNGAGDSGSTCLDGSPNTIAVPSDAPHGTAVGGSTVRSGPGSPYASETWWDGTGATPPTGQGGFGVSRFFSRPSYQDGKTASAMRSVPDVVANADPANGVIICQASDGGCPTGAFYGGTSYSAPLWAAYTAVVNEAIGHNLGFANLALYGLAGTPAFHDATSMGSDFAHVGLGSPNVDRLIAELSGLAIGMPDPHASLVSPALETQGIADFDAPIVVPADGASPGYVRVTLLDANHSTVDGKTVTLAGNPGSHVTISPASGVSDLHGSVVFTVKDLTAETVTFTAMDVTDGVQLASPTLPFVVPSAAAASIVADQSSVTADGTSTVTITVTLQDALQRPTPGKQITLSQGSGRSIIVGPSPSVTDAGGKIVFTATDLVNETVTYTAVDVSDGDLPVPGSAVVTFGNGNNSACAATLTPPRGANGNVVTAWATGFVAQNFNFGNVNWSGCPGASNPTFEGGSAYVADFPKGQLFKFGSGGGAATSGNILASLSQTLGQPTFGKDGSLYATFSATTGNFTTGAIVQLDPATGAILRTVASNLTCPNGLAVDPLSGDLFFDDACTGAGSDDPAIHRVINPSAASPSVVTYATLPTTPNGGLAFAPNGTLYAVTGYFNNPQAPIVRVSGTDQPGPPSVVTLPGVTTAFGVAVGETLPDGEAKSLLVVPNGTLTLVDITTTPFSSSVLANNLGVGTIGPDGCLYATDNATIYKVTNAAGGCGFAPTNPSPSLGLAPEELSPDPAQGTAQSFTATLHNVPAVAGTPVLFQVSGANPGVQMVRADASGNAVLTYTAAAQGEDTIVAHTTVNGSTLTSNAAHVRWGAGKHVTFLTLNPSPAAGSPGQPVSVVASLTDSSTQTAVGGAAVAFALGSAQCSGTTGPDGLAVCQLTPASPGINRLTATFAGTDQLLGSSDSIGFNVVVPSVQATCSASCDDGDGCTSDACADGQCQHTPPAGLPGVTCYLDALTSALKGAPKSDLRPAVKRQLLGKVRALGKLVRMANHPGKTGAKALKKLQKKLNGLVGQLQKLPAKKVATALDQLLVVRARGALAAMP